MKNLSQEQISKAAVEGERHYLAHLAALSETVEIRCKTDLYADNVVFLADEGQLIQPEFFKKVNGHKLDKPLEEYLHIQRAVTLQEVVVDLAALLQEDRIFGSIDKVKLEYEAHAAELAELELPSELIPKLTVLKKQLPDLYRHTLQVILMGLYISSELKLEQAERNALFLSALFHDIGELYIDPVILNSKSPLSTAARYQIYAHPVVAFMLLKHAKLFKASAGRAVLEHHERLDGSGYPRGIKAEEISRIGSMLGVAEFSIGVCDKYPGEEALIHLRIMVTIHKNWFPQQLVETITSFTREIVQTGDMGNLAVDQQVLMGKLFTIDKALHDWQHVNRQMNNRLLSNPERYLIKIMDERLQDLHQAFLRIGLQSEAVTEFVEILMQDGSSLHEVTVIVQELQFQLKSLMLEVRRRWPDDKFRDSPYSYINMWLNHIEGSLFSR